MSTNISACRLHSSVDRGSLRRSRFLIDSIHTSLASVKPTSAYKNIYNDVEGGDPTQYVTFDKKSVDVWMANHSPGDPIDVRVSCSLGNMEELPSVPVAIEQSRTKVNLSAYQEDTL